MKTRKKIEAKIENDSESEKISRKKEDFHPTPAEYLHLLYAVAEQFHARYRYQYDLCELVSMGYFGLHTSCIKYTRDISESFETYAISLIRFSIFDQMRNVDHLSRKDREMWKTYIREEREQAQSLGRYPTHEEIIEASKIKSSAFVPVLFFESSVISNRNQEFELDQIEEPEEEKDVEQVIDLLEAMKQLDPVLRESLQKRFFENKDLSVIGQEAGITKAGALVRIQKGIAQLRTIMLKREKEHAL